MKRYISIILSCCIILALTACGSSAKTDSETVSETSAEVETTTEIDESIYGNTVPELYEDMSEFVGPWAFMMYALDEGNPYICHEVDDDYEPKAGDILITGDDWDYDFMDEDAFFENTGIREFPYGEPDYVWNGHILYISDYSDGIVTCYEGNTIAPGQDLDSDDEDYIYLSSIDQVQIELDTSKTLTEDKPDEKQVRIIIETDFSPSFVKEINECAEDILEDFEDDPDAVRREIMDLYPLEDIDWCALYVHYLLLTAQEAYES